MNIIRQSNSHILEMLGVNYPHEGKNYRLIKYLIINDEDNGKAIYNCLTCSAIWISNEEFVNLFNPDANPNYAWFWDNYYLVNEDFDEAYHTNNLKTWLRPNPEHESYLASGSIKSFTIFTTMACNARCWYCYEKGRPQTPMKADTARKVADYIISHAVKNGEPISLSWFGGEPLVNENVIDIICEKIKKAGFKYNSSITSNGLLFKEEKLDKYRDLWHLTSGQITIDGTEEVYNKAKNYKNVKGKNPYEIVLNNIHLLIDHGINIAIRINLDLYNAEDVKKLIPELYNKLHLKDYKNKCGIYCWPIFEEGDYHRSEEENQKLFEYLKEIDVLLNEYDVVSVKPLAGNIRATHCMIDNGTSVLIGTQGDIGLCEHYSDDNFWGHIDDDNKRDMNMIKSFMDYEEPTELCNDCPLVPQCIRPKKCLDLRECSPYVKDWHIREWKGYLRNEYRNVKKIIEKENLERSKYLNCQHNNESQIEEHISFWDKILIKLGFK